MANAQSATRDLPTSVDPSTNFDVDMTISSGFIGQLKETLPAGFLYVGSTLDPGAVNVVGQVVTFTLVLDTSFTYTVQSSATPGTYPFSRYLQDLNLTQYTVTGDTDIFVGVPPELQVRKRQHCTIFPACIAV